MFNMVSFKTYLVLLVSVAVGFYGCEACCSVNESHGQNLSTTSDLKTNQVSIPPGIDGLNVLHLGSGSGRDCYAVANLVGPKGFVTGIAMTQENLDAAQKHANEYCINKLKYPQPNMKFVLGKIEDLHSADIKDATQDLIIWNSAINFFSNQRSVIEGAFNALRDGGELYFSDIYTDSILPPLVKHDPIVSANESIRGAMFVEEFKKICADSGFSPPLQVSKSVISLSDPKLNKLLGDVQFYSITYRMFKVKSTDQKELAVQYLGTICENETQFLFGEKSFYKNMPVLVNGTTLAVLTQSWMKSHFEVVLPIAEPKQSRSCCSCCSGSKK